MRAALFKKVGQPLVVEDIPVPAIGPRDVLVRVKACGICSTDRHILGGARKLNQLPHILGHEMAGVVADIGCEVRGFEAGERVLMNPLLTCGDCPDCSRGNDNRCGNIRKLIGIDDGFAGAFAEYIRVPARNLFHYPAGISVNHAVLITSVLSTAYHAAWRGAIKPGDRVVVFGCGPIGLAIIQSSLLFGAIEVIGIDVSDRRLELSRKVGATHSINAAGQDPVEMVRQLTHGKGAEVVFEVVGNEETIVKAVQCLGRGGNVVWVGIQFKPLKLEFDDIFRDVVHKEASILSTWAYRRQEFPLLIELVEAGKIDFSHAVIEEMPLDRVNQGIEMANSGRVDRVNLCP